MVIEYNKLTKKDILYFINFVDFSGIGKSAESMYLKTIKCGIKERQALKTYSSFLEDNSFDGDVEGFDYIIIAKTLDEAIDLAKKGFHIGGDEATNLYVIIGGNSNDANI